MTYQDGLTCPFCENWIMDDELEVIAIRHEAYKRGLRDGIRLSKLRRRWWLIPGVLTARRRGGRAA